MTSQLKTAADFIKQNSLKTVDTVLLKKLISERGYKVVEYGKNNNEEQTQNLLNLMSVSDTQNLPCAFICVKDGEKVLFLAENLTEAQKLYILCRELGVILSGNAEDKSNNFRVESDRKANEFAICLLGLTNEKNALLRFAANPSRIIFAILLAVVAVCLFSAFGAAVGGAAYLSYASKNQEYRYASATLSDNAVDLDAVYGAQNDESTLERADVLFDIVPEASSDGAEKNSSYVDSDRVYYANNSPEEEQTALQTENSEKSETAEAESISNETDVKEIISNGALNQASENEITQIYYATENGTKYHKAGCSYIKNKDNLVEIPSDSAKLDSYSPCSRCIK